MKKIPYLIIGLIIGYLANMFIGTQEPPTDAVNIVKPKGVITAKEAMLYDKNYNPRYELISDSILGKPDNRSSWYALSDMKNYLEYAQHVSDSLGYQMDGIRVYLGAHQPEGYTTMFFVPTGFKTGGMLPQKSNDIEGAGGLNNGNTGVPPNANYPQ